MTRGQQCEVRWARMLTMCVLAVGVATAAQAQTAKATAPAADLLPAFAVPESPALSFLGLSPGKVTRPTTPKDLAASLLNGVDSTGRMQSGVAIGATLWSIFPKISIPLSAYQNDWRAFALANLQLSLATVRAAGDTGATNLAIGFRTTLIDRSDPMRDSVYTEALTHALNICLRDAPPPMSPPGGGGGTAVPVVRDTSAKICADKKARALRSTWLKERRNASSLSVGVAAGWKFAQSHADSIRTIGWNGWLAGALPIDEHLALMGQLQFDHRGPVDTLGGTDILTYGLRAVSGSGTRNVFLEVVGTGRIKSAANTSRSNAQWSGGVEFQVAPGTWISTGFGTRYDRARRPSQMVVIANLRWGVGSESRLKVFNP